MVAATDRVDIIIFGATGFTGKCVVHELIKFTQTQELSWAVAGRNEQKLRSVLDWASLRTGWSERLLSCNKCLTGVQVWLPGKIYQPPERHTCMSVKHSLHGSLGRDMCTIRTIIADVGDEGSLNAMASQAKVIINCCGPYRFYGESVVKACIQNATHHVDVSGEPEYMETMQLKYHQAAEENGIFIISACGFDSVPVDFGVIHLVKHFPGVVNSVESYMACSNKSSEPAANIGTWESLVNAIPNVNNLRTLRRQIFSTLNRVKLEPRLSARSVIHRSPVFDNKLCMPFHGSDKTVVLRTQQSLHTFYKQRPVQFRPYFITWPFTVILGLAIMLIWLFTLSKFAYGRKLLVRYPEFFTFGTFSRTGPSEESRAQTYARFRFVGKGWSKDVAEKYELPEQINEPTNTRIVTEVSFSDFAYGFTAKSVILSAVTILRESQHIPLKGGVLTPGAAFANTNFLENLTGQSVSFKILSNL